MKLKFRFYIDVKKVFNRKIFSEMLTENKRPILGESFESCRHWKRCKVLESQNFMRRQQQQQQQLRM